MTLIDRDRAANKIEQAQFDARATSQEYTVDNALFDLGEMTDEVLRCADCACCVQDTFDGGLWCARNGYPMPKVTKDGFCAWGKEEG